MNPLLVFEHRNRLWWCRVLLLCLAAKVQTSCAQNLVPNAGFEETDSCTFGIGASAIHDWHSASITFDHLQNCQPYGSINGLPLNTFTFQQPFEGNSCIGLFTYYQNGMQEQREWAIVPLVVPLVVGQTYYWLQGERGFWR